MLDKIRKLMALALNNPSEEEARSAALKAVRMIAEHKVVLALTALKAKSADLAGSDAPQPPPRPDRYEDIMRDLQDRMRQAEADAFWKPGVNWSAYYEAPTDKPWK